MKARSSRLLAGILLAIGLVGCARPGDSGIRKFPPPILFRWTPSAASDARTPQQAFAAGMRLDLCQPVAARSVVTTWLASGPDYGAAWVVADCRDNRNDPRPMQALFLVRRDRQDGPKCDYWMAVSAGFVQKALTGPMPNAERAQVPAWLSLPPDTYHETPAMTSLHPLSSLRSWMSASRVFITGRFEGQATRPADGATLVRVAGRSGWLVPGQGLVSVVVPLATGWTFFFSGTAVPDQVQQLAASTLDHIQEALPPEPIPANVDPIAWC
jgi:hypothetical protein